ncbi:MAG: hypothetical protein LBS11_08485 [Oscillospiraceae bacterium]|jgi:uncharacterized membrane protein|nr:hypothetical protein [Oscillospiraceae bacterium]
MYNHQEPETPAGAVISNNPTVNLTATLASLSFLAGLFLCFADTRSRTIRRYSVQSVGLGAIWIAFIMAVWILALLAAYIPFVGGALEIAFWIIGGVGTLVCFALRVRMMFSAYRGLAYALPVIGSTLRKFE